MFGKRNMANDNDILDWKLKLRYGKLETSYSHYTVLASGRANQPIDDFDCPIGSAWMASKMWAINIEQAADIIQSIARQINFEITGDIQVFDSEAVNPPKDNPYGYDINFTPFTED